MKINSTYELLRENERINKNCPFNKYSVIDCIEVSDKLRAKISALDDGQQFNLMACSTRISEDSEAGEVFYNIDLQPYTTS